MKLSGMYSYQILKKVMKYYDSADDVFWGDGLIDETIENSSKFLQELARFDRGEIDSIKLMISAEDMLVPMCRVIRLETAELDIDSVHDISINRTNRSLYFAISSLISDLCSDKMSKASCVASSTELVFSVIEHILRSRDCNVDFDICPRLGGN